MMTLPKRNYLLTIFLVSVSASTSASSIPPLEDDLRIPDIADISIDVNGVFKLMQKLDVSKAAGPAARFLYMFKITRTHLLLPYIHTHIYHSITFYAMDNCNTASIMITLVSHSSS